MSEQPQGLDADLAMMLSRNSSQVRAALVAELAELGIQTSEGSSYLTTDPDGTPVAVFPDPE